MGEGSIQSWKNCFSFVYRRLCTNIMYSAVECIGTWRGWLLERPMFAQKSFRGAAKFVHGLSCNRRSSSFVVVERLFSRCVRHQTTKNTHARGQRHPNVKTTIARLRYQTVCMKTNKSNYSSISSIRCSKQQSNKHPSQQRLLYAIGSSPCKILKIWKRELKSPPPRLPWFHSLA